MPRRGLLIDIEGTLVSRDAALPGVDEVLEWLRATPLALRFVTNIDSRSSGTISAQLWAMGLPVAPDDIICCASGLIAFLGERPGARCHLLVSDDVRAEVAGLIADGPPYEYAILGDFHHELTLAALNTLYQHVAEGAQLVALMKEPFSITAHGRVMETGAFAAAVEYAAGCEAYVIGKPSTRLLELALKEMGVAPQDAIVVGDDRTTDVRGARAIGARAILVRTGKYAAQEGAGVSDEPDLVIDSFADLPGALAALGVVAP